MGTHSTSSVFSGPCSEVICLTPIPLWPCLIGPLGWAKLDPTSGSLCLVTPFAGSALLTVPSSPSWNLHY